MTVELFWPNGKIKRRLKFENGVRQGTDEMWSSDGVLVDSSEYKDGKLISFEEPEKVPEKKKYLLKKAVLPKVKKAPSELLKKDPLLFLVSKSWKSVDAPFESLKPFSIGGADVLYVYGLGMGAPYFQLKRWLHENKMRKLIFVEENEGHFASFLGSNHAHLLINDPQVHLEWQKEHLAEKYPFEQIEVVCLGSKKGNAFNRFKLDLLKNTTLSFALHVDRLQGHIPYKNFVKNSSHIPNSFYVNGLKDKFKGFPAIVCGAGPSLEKAIPHLKKLSKNALIIAGGSTLAALSSQGVPIHFGMAIDPNLEEYKRFKNSFAFDTPLIYSTRVHPSIFQTCNGPFGYMRSGIGGPLELWMEEALERTDPLIGDSLPPESIAVTPIATAFAEFLGCNQILFSGVDLAYTNAKRYASGVTINKRLSFSSVDDEKTVSDRILKRKNHEGKTIHTATRWVMESKSLSTFAKKNQHVEFFNTCLEGLPIKGVPYKALETFQFEKELPEIDFPSMPKNSSHIIEEKINDLKTSIARVVSHLEVLAGKKKGSKALSEIELQEELAFDLLFYDMNHIFENRADKWNQFLSLSKNYL